LFNIFKKQHIPQAYIKLTSANVKIKVHDNPFKSPNAFLPFLEDLDHNLKIAGYNKIVDYLGTRVNDKFTIFLKHLLPKHLL
jgi:hypothetical protein